MQRGRAVFAELCETCHGQPEAAGIRSMDRATIIPVRELGAERIRRTIRTGQGQMPAFEDDMLARDNLDALVTWLTSPNAGGRGGGRGPAQPPLPPPPEGVVRYTGPLGTMFRTSNGLSAISPPWAQIVAYDLNEGVIKWRAPLGNVPALAAKGIRGTGNNQRVHRNGPAVTAGGLIFVGSWGDRTVHAYDKDNGKILWEKELEANPEGLAAVYEVDGREYIAFCASGSPQNADANSIAAVTGKIEAQGYYVFALPKPTQASKKK
jgi:quinoprotein glucose dehydrogenase